MTLGVLKETTPETRVSLLPEHLSSLVALNSQVLVEKDAGKQSYASDDQYRQAGATILERNEVLKQAELLLSLHLPPKEEYTALSGKKLLGHYQPMYQKENMQQLAANGASVFSLDMLPRTTRAQSMDVLSSQANIAGYKAVIIAANLLPKYFPMFMTAAGSIAPAKVLILGAGVAGLQGIATARRLGAVVEVFDTRPAVKEEVQSLGGKFIEVDGAADASGSGGYAVEQSDSFKALQHQKIAEAVKKANVVITTAQIFGKKAPVLLPEEMIRSMKPGAVIVDIASATGGNTACTKDNETISVHDVTIVGNSHLAATVPADASKMYGKNISNFLHLLISKEGKYSPDLNDELITGAMMTDGGKIVSEFLNKENG